MSIYHIDIWSLLKRGTLLSEFKYSQTQTGWTDFWVEMRETAGCLLHSQRAEMTKANPCVAGLATGPQEMCLMFKCEISNVDLSRYCLTAA